MSLLIFNCMTTFIQIYFQIREISGDLLPFKDLKGYDVVHPINPNNQYKGYEVVRVNIDDSKAIASIHHFQQSHPLVNLDYWITANVPTKFSDIMLPPDQIAPFKALLNQANVNFTEIIKDVQKLVDDQKECQLEMTRLRQEFPSSEIYFDRYPTLNEIQDWIDHLKTTYPDLVDTIVIGQSYEKRPMTVLKIGVTKTGNDSLPQPKPAIWIDAGIHAREWITVTTLIYFISQLLESNRWSNDTKLHDLSKSYLDKFDFYILPVHNPDGYDYTHKTDRLWRKTRSPNKDSSCYGTDANRNWGHYSFGLNGASSNPCSLVYHGSGAFSEIETVNVRDFLMNLGKSLISYMSIHSYSQLWLLPYGYTFRHPKDYDLLYQIGLDAVSELKKVHGTVYQVGSIPDLLYLASGSSIDYAYDVLHIQYSMSIELRDTGNYGFLLPPSEILPTAQETWEAYKVVLNNLLLLKNQP